MVSYNLKKLAILVGLSLPLLLINSKTAYDNPISISDAFRLAAAESGIDENLLRAVCWVESSHKVKLPLKLDGSTPSYGICQIKIATARMLGFKGSVIKLKNPIFNIHVAARYIKFQMMRYAEDWRKAVTAYNRGSYKKKYGIHNIYVIKVTFALHEKPWVKKVGGLYEK